MSYVRIRVDVARLNCMFVYYIVIDILVAYVYMGLGGISSFWGEFAYVDGDRSLRAFF